MSKPYKVKKQTQSKADKPRFTGKKERNGLTGQENRNISVILRSQFKCPYCSFCGSSQSAINNHMAKTADPSYKSPYRKKCDRCEREFCHHNTAKGHYCWKVPAKNNAATTQGYVAPQTTQTMANYATPAATQSSNAGAIVIDLTQDTDNDVDSLPTGDPFILQQDMNYNDNSYGQITLHQETPVIANESSEDEWEANLRAELLHEIAVMDRERNGNISDTVSYGTSALASQQTANGAPATSFMQSNPTSGVYPTNQQPQYAEPVNDGVGFVAQEPHLLNSNAEMQGQNQEQSDVLMFDQDDTSATPELTRADTPETLSEAVTPRSPEESSLVDYSGNDRQTCSCPEGDHEWFCPMFPWDEFTNVEVFLGK